VTKTIQMKTVKAKTATKPAKAATSDAGTKIDG